MISFSQLAEPIKGGLVVWLFLICLLFFFNTVIHYFTDRKAFRMLISVTETALALVLVQLFLYQVNEGKGIVTDIPVLAVLLLDIVLTMAAVFDIARRLRMKERELTPMSVKECMDELPVGICFYWDGGLTKLTNLKMDSIAQRLTDSSLSDAESFRKTVFSSEEAPVLNFEDGTTYSFVHRKDDLDGKVIHELLAFDVTEEYRLTQELREKQRRARIINTRLKALNSTIQYIIMDKETLRIKMHIHDSLGKTLLMTRRYLAEPEKTDLNEVLSLWGRNIAMLKNEEREDWQEPHFVSFHHAEAMGIEIKLRGELPEDDSLSYAVDSAITAHVTNVLRHAVGNVAYISCEKTADGYVMRFTNNGRKPESPVEEKGGLVNLRRLIESIGGSMEIISFPAFEMIIHLPEHVEEEW